MRCIRARRVMKRRRQRLESFRKEQAIALKDRLLLFDSVVQSKLADGGGGVFICVEIGQFKTYVSANKSIFPWTKDDMINHLDWWLIDVSRAYDNCRRLTQVEKETIYDLLYVTKDSK